MEKKISKLLGTWRFMSLLTKISGQFTRNTFLEIIRNYNLASLHLEN